MKNISSLVEECEEEKKTRENKNQTKTTWNLAKTPKASPDYNNQILFTLYTYVLYLRCACRALETLPSTYSPLKFHLIRQEHGCFVF